MTNSNVKLIVYDYITKYPFSTIYKHLDTNNEYISKQLNINIKDFEQYINELVIDNKLTKELQFIIGNNNFSSNINNKSTKHIYSYK